MGLGSTIGKYIAIVVGVAFYFLTLSELLEIRAQKQEAETLFHAVDKNLDDKITRKELDAFEPTCEDFALDKFVNKLDGIGRRVTLKEFQSEVTPRNIKQYMQGCAEGAEIFSNPAKMSKLFAEDIQEEFFELYDLNQDGGVLWSEYSFVNSFNKRASPEARDTFKFLDRVRLLDWKITTKEFAKAKLDRLGQDEGKKRHKKHRK